MYSLHKMENTTDNVDAFIDMIPMTHNPAEKECRYCYKPAAEGNELIKLCDCSEVHAKCLEKWKNGFLLIEDAKRCKFCEMDHLITARDINRRNVSLNVMTILSIIWNIINIVGFLGYDHLGEIEISVIFIGSIIPNMFCWAYVCMYLVIVDRGLWRDIFFIFTIEMTIVHFVVAIVTSIIMKTPMFCIFTSVIAFQIVTSMNLIFMLFVAFCMYSDAVAC